MARRKRGKRRTSPGKDAVAKNTGDATQPVPTSVNPSPDVPPRRRRFVIAAGIVGCWWAVLIALVVLTANPVTLNRRQLRNSSRVVTAEIVDVDHENVVTHRLLYLAYDKFNKGFDALYHTTITRMICVEQRDEAGMEKALRQLSRFYKKYNLKAEAFAKVKIPRKRYH